MKPGKEVWKKEDPTVLKPDISVLEGAVFTSRLPIYLWDEDMLFYGADDFWLREMTGAFPSTLRKDKKTHPVFILSRTGNFALKLCPCSTKVNNGRYIVRGCKLKMTGNTTDKDSYILSGYSFNLPVNQSIQPKLKFGGKVPPECIMEIK